MAVTQSRLCTNSILNVATYSTVHRCSCITTHISDDLMSAQQVCTCPLTGLTHCLYKLHINISYIHMPGCNIHE